MISLFNHGISNVHYKHLYQATRIYYFVMVDKSRIPPSLEEILKAKREKRDGKDSIYFIPKERRGNNLSKNHPKTINKSQNKSASSTIGNGQIPVQTFDSDDKKVLLNSNARSEPPNNGLSNRKKKAEKFLFDWSSRDDTTDQSDLLYNNQSHSIKTEDDSVLAEIHRRKRLLSSTLNTNKKKRLNDSDAHWSKKKLDEMKERDWRIFKEDFSILTRGGNLPRPIRFWNESTVPREILQVIQDMGYTNPTPIQRAAIPIALSGRDVIGIAETGSGKTVSFVVPMLDYIMKFPALNEVSKNNGPYSIVLAPTRELALQIESELKKFCQPLGFRCASLVGGHSIEEQVHNLQQGAEIVVATPGRLVDALERRILVLNQCTYVVMDEADRMIDLGFEEQVNKILDALPSSIDNLDIIKVLGSEKRKLLQRRQMMMYTATWPKEIEKLAEKYLQRPGIVNIGNVGQATDRVEQRTEFIQSKEKRIQRLLSILNSRYYHPPIIIFVNYRSFCDSISKSLNSNGWKSVVMHGSRSQEQREQALAQLRTGAADCLVATDVAGRGIDVPDVSLVINFQMAKSVEDYTHRIGRTGRAGKSGVSITFLGPEDDDVIPDLKRLIGKSSVSRLSDELRRYKDKGSNMTLT